LPTVCIATLVPAGTLTVPHWFATHVAVMQAPPVVGQSLGVVQFPIIPPLLELALLLAELLALLVAEPPPALAVEPPPVPIPPAPPVPALVLDAVEPAVVEPVVLDALEGPDTSPPVPAPDVVPPARESLPQPSAEGRRAKAEARVK
jgi:hypothetical protein